MSTEPTEDKDITVEDINETLKGIPEQVWKDADYPLLTFVSGNTFSQYELGDNKKQSFWKEALFPGHFLAPDKPTTLDPDKHFLFIILPLNPLNEDSNFQAIRVNSSDFVSDPYQNIKKEYHKGGLSPQINFWDFYDGLDSSKQNIFVVPDTNFRKIFTKKNILKNNV